MADSIMIAGRLAYVGCILIVFEFKLFTAKRCMSIDLYPVFSGAATIRAFGSTNRFLSDFMVTLGDNVRCHYLNAATFFWQSTRLDLLGSTVVFGACTLVLASRQSISTGLASLCITYSVECLSTLGWMVHKASCLEITAISLERIFEYFDLRQEEVEAAVTTPDWPSEGAITFRDFSMRYRRGLPLVLKSVDLEIKPGEKVGVCGRTGAGKSSLGRALLRLVDDDDEDDSCGSVEIDGVDIATVGRERLREAVTVIPQVCTQACQENDVTPHLFPYSIPRSFPGVYASISTPAA